MAFVFSLDSPSMEGHEFESRTHEEMLALFAWLCDVGADVVELGIAYVIEIVRQQFPELEVRSAESFRVHRVRQGELLQDLGVRSSIVSQAANRNFPLLSAMSRELDTSVMLNASGVALREDPHDANLNRACALGSLSSPRVPADVYALVAELYYYAYRVKLALDSPVSLLKSGFIRPEDLCKYETLGIERFRVDTAGLDTDETVLAVQAYSNRHFDRDLTGIVPFLRCPIGEEAALIASGSALQGLVEGLLDPDLLENLATVDNRALTGFLDRFVERACPFYCGDCEWCDEWTEKAVRVNSDGAARFKGLFEQFSLFLEEGESL